MTTDTPRTDAACFSSRDPMELMMTSQQLERELNASKADVERLRSQFNRAVEIAEMFRQVKGLHYQCNCRSCQMLAEIKRELEWAVYGCDCDNYLQTYCDKHNPHTNK